MKKRKMNPIDILVIVVILAVVLLAGYKFVVVNKIQSTGIAKEEKNMEYTGVVKGVRQPTVDAFHVGDKMYDDKTGVYMGEIKNIDSKPQKTVELLPTGEFSEVEKIDYFDVTLTLSGPILNKEKGYFISGTMELKLNSEFPVFTKFAKPNIQLTSISL